MKALTFLRDLALMLVLFYTLFLVVYAFGG